MATMINHKGEKVTIPNRRVIPETKDRAKQVSSNSNPNKMVKNPVTK